MANEIKIYGALDARTQEGIAARAHQIYDNTQAKFQSVLNAENLTALGNKVDKVSGKGLSTNDYTTTEKEKLGGMPNVVVATFTVADVLATPLSSATITKLIALRTALGSAKVVYIPNGEGYNQAVVTSAGSSFSFNFIYEYGESKYDIVEVSADASDNYTVTRTTLAQTADLSDYYIKPDGGIPKTDLTEDVQTSLGKADSAYQKPSDGIPLSDIDPSDIDDVPTAGSNNLVKSGGIQNELALGAVYDVSAKNPTAGPNNDGKFTLAYILNQSNVDTLIPSAVRKGGMSIKFVQSSDNKYVQYGLTAQTFSINVSDWRNVEDEVDNIREWTNDTFPSKNGYYPKMSVGLANNINGGGTVVDGRFFARMSGGSTDFANGTASLHIIKGKTVGWNQLVEAGYYYDGAFRKPLTTKTINGVTFTAQADGSILVDGTAEGGDADLLLMYKYKYGACTLFVKGCPAGGDQNTYFMYHQSFSPLNFAIDVGYGAVYNTSNIYVAIEIKNGYTADNLVFKPQIINLTMLGYPIVYPSDNTNIAVKKAWIKQMETWMEEIVGLKNYRPYQIGNLVSTKFAKLKSIGRNLCKVTESTGIARLVAYTFGDVVNTYGITGTYTSLSFTDELGNVSTPVPDSNGIFTTDKGGVLTVTGAGADTYVWNVYDGTMDGEEHFTDYYEDELNCDVTKLYGKLNGSDSYIQVATNGLRSAGDIVDLVDLKKKTAKISVGNRAYESGDESDATLITDKTTTNYPLVTPLQYTDLMLSDDGGQTFYDIPVNFIADNRGIEETYPQNEDGEDVITTAPLLTCEYPFDVVEPVKQFLQEGQTSTSITDTLANLKTTINACVENNKRITAVTGPDDDNVFDFTTEDIPPAPMDYTPKFLTASQSSLETDGTLEISDTPNTLTCYNIGLMLQFATFGRIDISKGVDFMYSCGGEVEIDDTNIYVHNPIGSGAISNTIPHGLTISDFLTVNICADSKAAPVGVLVYRAKITLTTGRGQSFNTIIDWTGTKGNVKVKSVSGSYTNVKLSYGGDAYFKDIWVFGDSYLNTWPRYAMAQDADNYMLDGFPGANSSDEYTSLQKCLTLGTPKYLIWSLGMNDADSNNAVNSSWLNVFNNLKILCIDKGIKLIPVTIPNVSNTNYNNYYKNQVIKESGLYYIDVAEAVGGTERGSSWYPDLLRADGVHPSNEAGSKVIAECYIAQMPLIKK